MKTAIKEIKVDLEAELSKEFVENVIEQIRSALAKWMSLSKDFGISNLNRKLIQKAISKL